MAPDSLRRHSSHDFRCSICDRSYAKKEHVQRHERSHTGHRPFVCNVCGRTFTRQDALNRHARVHRRTAPTSANAQGDVINGSTLAHEQLNSRINPSVIPPLTIEGNLQQPQPQFPFLFWPDSEDLLQNILSIDPTLLDQPPAYLPPPPTGHASPVWDYANGNATERLGEGQRAIQTLSTLLSNTMSGVMAPAALTCLTSRFLDSCLHMFFSTFVPMMPVIHRPTFVFQDCSPPLLLNAIAIGSLFLGSEDASEKGNALWRLAHTAVQTSWYTMIKHRGEFDIAPGTQLVQTALLSQIYAALSKSRNLRITSQVFHGLGFYWARYCGLFDLPDVPVVPRPHEDSRAKYRQWRLWLARETQLRSLLALYIIDGVISQYSGSPTVAQHMSNQLLIPSSEASFTADNPDDWIQTMTTDNGSCGSPCFCDIFRHLFNDQDPLSEQIPPDMSSFTLKVILEGLKSLVAESKRIEPRPVGVPSQAEIHNALNRVREYIHAHLSLTPIARSTAMLRWHAICLDAVSVTARGARRLCATHGISQHIFGGGTRAEKNIQPERYINTDDARRTILHASEIHRIASQLPIGLAHDVHIPGAVFAAATTYSAFALAGKTQMWFPELIDWQQAVLLRSRDGQSEATSTIEPDVPETKTAQFIHGVLNATHNQKDVVFRDISHELSSIRLLLRALSLQWGVCAEMEEVVDAWIAKCT